MYKSILFKHEGGNTSCLCVRGSVNFSHLERKQKNTQNTSFNSDFLPRKSKPIRFKHFTRKGYALFACLGKEVIIGVLTVTTLTHAKASGISVHLEKASDSIQNGCSLKVTQEGGVENDCLKLPQNLTPKEDADTLGGTRDSVFKETVPMVMLSEVGILGSRVPMPRQSAVRMVTILDKQTIQSQATLSVNDVLKNISGVDVRQRGPIGQQADIGIRGGTSEHVALLLDGINICDPQTAHNAMDLPVDVMEVDKILITEGPAARAYGASALLGAINFITLEPRENNLSLKVEGGSFGFASLNARVALCEGLWGNSLSVGYSRSDGYSRSKEGRLNSDFENFKAFYKGQFEDSLFRISWHAGMSLKGWGSSTFYSVLSDEQYERTVKYYTALKAETKKGKVRFSPLVYWNRFHDRYEFYRSQQEASPYNYNRTDILGVEVNAYMDWALGRTVLATDLRSEWLRSSNLGEPLKRVKRIKGTDKDYTLGLDRTNISICIEHNVNLRWFNVSLGLVGVKNTWSDMPFKLYPGLDVSYSPFDDLKVFASYNSSLRMPSYTELYYSVDGHKADKHLLPEEMFSLETGVRYILGPLKTQLKLFRHEGHDMIDWIMDTSLKEDAQWESVNHAKITALGTEVSLNLDLEKLFSSQHILHEVGLAYGYIDQNQKRQPQIQSLYALEYLRHKLTAMLALKIIKDLGLNINCRYQYRVGTYTDIDAIMHKYKPYFITDVKLSFDKKRYSLYMQANNLFSKRYVDYGNVLEPGIWFTVGAKYNMSF